MITIGFSLLFIVYRLLDANQFRSDIPTLAAFSSKGIVFGILWSHPMLGIGLIAIFLTLSMQRKIIRSSPWLLLAGLVLFYSLRFFTGQVDLVYLVAILSSLLMGAGVVGCFSGWVTIISTEDSTVVLGIILIGSVLSALVRMLVYLIDSTAVYYIVLLAAFLISIVIFYRLYGEAFQLANRTSGCDDKTSSPTVRVSSSIVRYSLKTLHDNYMQPIICIAVVSLALAMIQPLAQTTATSNNWTLVIHFIGILVGSLALLAFWNRNEILFRSYKLSYVLVAITIIGFAVYPFFGEGYSLFLICLTSALYASLIIALFSIGVEETEEDVALGLPSVGFLLGIMYVFTFLGSWFNGYLAQNGGSLGIQESFIVALCIIAVAALSAIIPMIFAKSAGTDAQSTPQVVSVMTTVSEEQMRGNRTLRTTYGLSEREVDVLVLLLSARSTPSIARALFISENTVKTHARHLYAKLGVHNKEELADLVALLVENERRNQGQ